MKNITLDTTSFSEQLELYDFFNVLICGVTFICGISLLSEKIYHFLWDGISFQKGLGIVLIIYITGMILQELGSAVDKKWTNIYQGMYREMLKGTVDETFDKTTFNTIVENPVVLQKGY